LERVPEDKRVWLDESGIDHGLVPTHGWAVRGQKLYAVAPGGRRARTSILAALTRGEFVWPWLLTGSFNKLEFLNWLLSVAPGLSGRTVILDNIPFHHSPEVRHIASAFGFDLLYLPAYSPDLNPIEHCWANLKRALRPKLDGALDAFPIIETFVLSQC
jgi:hypothetical protein